MFRVVRDNSPVIQPSDGGLHNQFLENYTSIYTDEDGQKLTKYSLRNIE